MSTSADEPCAICDKPGKLRCGACKAIVFCSVRCQRILWPVHKTLCGRDPDVFYVPPLLPSEVERLENVKHNRIWPSDPSLIDGVRFSGFSWQEFLTLITLAEPPASSNPINMAVARNHFIMLARYHLFVSEMPQHQGIGGAAAWDSLGGTAFQFVEHWRQEMTARGVDGPDVYEVWRVFNQILRLELGRAALKKFYNSTTGADTAREFVHLEILALERGLAEIERADLPPGTREHARASFRRRLEHWQGTLRTADQLLGRPVQ